MAEYRIVRRHRRVEIYDPYGRCVETVLERGGWTGASELQPAATDAHIVSLIEQGESTGSFGPHRFEEHRTYDSTTRTWSSRTWPSHDE